MRGQVRDKFSVTKGSVEYSPTIYRLLRRDLPVTKLELPKETTSVQNDFCVFKTVAD